MTPTIAEITAAARASAQTNPRPTRAYWLAACRIIVEPDPETTVGGTIALALCEAREWPVQLATRRTLADAQRLAIEHLEAMGEADLRAAFVELSILASANEDAARILWAGALGLDSGGT